LIVLFTTCLRTLFSIAYSIITITLCSIKSVSTIEEFIRISSRAIKEFSVISTSITFFDFRFRSTTCLRTMIFIALLSRIIIT
jgi:hypothetical protein